MTNLHAKLIAERDGYRPLTIERDGSGRPGYVRIVRKCSGEVVARGHRDTLRYWQTHRADDPDHLLSRPDTSD